MVDNESLVITCEKTADRICAELLISKHSEEYRKIVLYIARIFDIQNNVKFDDNNVPYYVE